LGSISTTFVDREGEEDADVCCLDVDGFESSPLKPDEMSIEGPFDEFTAVCCNRTDVDLEPATDPKDIEILHRLISRHAELTKSPQAEWILKNWEATLPRFIKVFPHEYKRVLGIPRIPTGVLVAQAKKQAEVHGQVIGG